MKQWYGSMRIAHVTKLEDTFAYLTPDGWRVPEWLHWLRVQILTHQEVL